MGLFAQEEQGAPDAPRGGFLKRFRAPRSSFVEPGSSAEPKFAAPKPVAAEAKAPGIAPGKPRGDASTVSTRAVNPQVMFLGRALSGGDVEDVESTELDDDWRGSVPPVQTQSGPEGDAVDDEPGFRPFVPPSFERPSYASMSAAMAARERGQPVNDEALTAQATPSGAQHRSKPQAELQVEPPQPQPHPQPQPELGLERRSAAASSDSIRQASVAGSDANAERFGAQPEPAPQRPASPNEHKAASAPTIAAQEYPADDEEQTEGGGLASGRPELVSPDSLPDFKRVLTVADDDAALRIPAAARKEFVAVELQPGVAITVATARFAEKAQYATFIKDLGANDILVREEMIATEAVIAAIYSGKAAASANSTVREASRAIGNFRDIVEAAHAYGASDIHFEPREFHNEVEIRFRVNGDMYTFSRMRKAIVRRALFAAYSDLVQRNTNSGNSFQPSAPQSAMIPLVVKTDTVNLRWQSSPLVGGYDVALRLLDGNFKNYSVLLPKDMGFEKSQLELIETLNYVSGGITALTGETGSGKTTTLRALSYMLPDRELKKQFAVNEPSEYPMPWLSDYSIIRRPDETDDEANRKYAEVIRTLMRQDPDDLTIGEVRDRVVMGLVAELALTGHPVRFSLHAGDIIAAVMRMAGGRLQLPIDELASEGFINAVGNQKLIPTLCEHCKLPAEDVMPKADLELLRTKFGLDTSRMACRNYDGCEHCRLKGLFTRNGKAAGGTTRPSLAAELYRPTPEFLERVAERDWAGARKVWRGERRTGFDNADMTGKTLYEHALFKASRGLIDPQFINRSMQSFAQYRVMPGVDGLMV
ncbi:MULTISPECIES: ATPase, T2SS/T4P/T4SS family [unclassified Caballeronia]|uniref:GspE/PulE family protein n=1 Tax=unclassified Caballeronia TaxID=2646786 RepID=UPI00285C35C4|nr:MULTISPECIES: ATPase, T2SS/T4P/T4SS family [unclassified Caballeronia]MDR5754980.1 ATPase, T2SS/T4P/T4SS family [Caballeronia sp. LZ024]MDR5845539.1 ATPase, T2SS/T4P/T4SS family [Caballeronia sp. LZ031]